MSMTPWGKDRLGCRSVNGGGHRQANTSISNPIPDEEHVLMEAWVTVQDETVPASAAVIQMFYESGATEFRFRLGPLGLSARIDGGGVVEKYVGHMPVGDHHLAMLIDRTAELLRIFVDGIQVDSADISGLTISFDAATLLYFVIQLSGTTEYNWVFWRMAVTSLTALPENLDDLMLGRVHPEAPMADDLVDVLGAFGSTWRHGEGVYGSATIEDVGVKNSGIDLTQAGGGTVDTYRVRARTPQPVPELTWYTLTPGYTATTAATDFGFLFRPTVSRWMLGDLHCLPTATTIAYFNTLGPNRLQIRSAVAGGVEIVVRSGGVEKTCPVLGDQLDGGDFWIATSALDAYIYIGGQYVHYEGALAGGGLDLSGAITFGLIASSKGQCCRVAAWNPATVPTTLEDEIARCVMDPAHDPPSLGTPLVDFPLNSELLPLGTETTLLNQGSGGGTLTFSAQRSTSCEEMIVGYNP